MTETDAMVATAQYFGVNHERIGRTFKDRLDLLADPEMIRFAYMLGMGMVMHFLKFGTPLPDDAIADMLGACADHQRDPGATVQ